MNGRRLTLSNDEAYDLVMAVATGELDDVAKIGLVLRLARLVLTLAPQRL